MGKKTTTEKPAKKKLKIERQSIKVLDPDRIRQVVGGMSVVSGSDSCCPNTCSKAL